jgi:hypothetical protein
MSNVLLPQSKVVIDAGVAIWAVLPLMSSLTVVDIIRAWRQAEVEIYAPSL